MSLTSGGGKPMVKRMPYDPPKGPIGINNPQTPGLHGTNMGMCGTQGGVSAGESMGKPAKSPWPFKKV
jgi:hypothetical protein